MATHRQIEQWWSDRKCTGPHVKLTLNGRYPVRVQPELEAATEALSAAIMSNGYRTPMGPTGSYACRSIGGSNTTSLHSYAVAIDWDYGKNPYLRGTKIKPGFKSDYRFDLTENQVNAVENIKNTDGDSIWRWLGWTIGDTMHFQVDVPPDKCQPQLEDGMPKEQWENMIDSLFKGRPDMFHGDPTYYYDLSADSPDWPNFWNAFVDAISLEGDN